MPELDGKGVTPMAGGPKLEAKQEQAIAALLEERTQADAAAKVGISERGLRNWLADETFLAAYRQARRQVVEHALARLQHASGEAVETLRSNLSCGDPGPANRAALGILEHSIKALEM